jgi:SnoaL-like domain
VSQENVEKLREGTEAFRRGDWNAVAADWDMHVLVRSDPSWPEQFIYGREAVMDWQRGAWESLGPDLRIEETVDLGDRLLARFCWHTRGQHSGIEGDLRWTSVNTYRDGCVVFAEYFLDHEQALKAVGLKE